MWPKVHIMAHSLPCFVSIFTFSSGCAPPKSRIAINRDKWVNRRWFAVTEREIVYKTGKGMGLNMHICPQLGRFFYGDLGLLSNLLTYLLAFASFILCFFRDFRDFGRVSSWHHRQLRFRAWYRWKAPERSFLTVLHSVFWVSVAQNAPAIHRANFAGGAKCRFFENLKNFWNFAGTPGRKFNNYCIRPWAVVGAFFQF